MATNNNAQRLRAALPSVSIADLAHEWSCPERVILDHVRAGRLQCVVRVSGNAFIGDDEVVELHGEYALDPRDADEIIHRASSCIAVFLPDGRRVRVVSERYYSRNQLRVAREEIERFEREVLGGRSATGVPPEERRPREEVILRERCKAAAAILLGLNPGMTVADVIDHPLFERHVVRTAEWPVNRETYDRWIRELGVHDRAPGRRKKTPASNPAND